MNKNLKAHVLGILLGAATLTSAGFTRAQAIAEPDLATRRQAILQRDQLITDDGRIIKADAALSPQSQSVFRQASWRGRYYGRPYAGYYGSPRGRYYARYPSYYQPYDGYRYPGAYYGTPRNGYYDTPYGGAARVGRFRVFW
jgi:hypothetical protein